MFGPRERPHTVTSPPHTQERKGRLWVWWVIGGLSRCRTALTRSYARSRPKRLPVARDVNTTTGHFSNCCERGPLGCAVIRAKCFAARPTVSDYRFRPVERISLGQRIIAVPVHTVAVSTICNHCETLWRCSCPVKIAYFNSRTANKLKGGKHDS